MCVGYTSVTQINQIKEFQHSTAESHVIAEGTCRFIVLVSGSSFCSVLLTSLWKGWNFTTCTSKLRMEDGEAFALEL